MIGTITGRTIFVVNPGSCSAEPWIQPDHETALGVYGLFAGEKHNTLWACFSDFPGKKDQPQAASMLKAFDPQTGSLKASYQLPTKGDFGNDIAIGADGTAYVPDTNNMEVNRLASGGQQLEVWAGNGGFGPKGGIVDGISVLGDRLFVSTVETNKVFSVPIAADGKAGEISEVKLNRAIENRDTLRPSLSIADLVQHF